VSSTHIVNEPVRIPNKAITAKGTSMKHGVKSYRKTDNGPHPSELWQNGWYDNDVEFLKVGVAALGTCTIVLRDNEHV
jgi:hypothetical protein